eukprot:6478071-Amphidinium_carterae.2
MEKYMHSSLQEETHRLRTMHQYMHSSLQEEVHHDGEPAKTALFAVWPLEGGDKEIVHALLCMQEENFMMVRLRRLLCVWT